MIRIVPLAACFVAGLVPAASAAKAPKPAQASQALYTLFSDEDYPADAVRNHEQGAVGFRLEVGADGRPTGCAVASSSGSSSLDSTTCRLLMERARFQPARDARGKATTDRVAGRIIWRLGEEMPPRLRAAMVLWTSCVMGEAAKLVPSDLPTDEILRRSFPPCAALEALVSDSIDAPAADDEARASIGRLIEKLLIELRTDLKAAEAATPEQGEEN